MAPSDEKVMVSLERGETSVRELFIVPKK